MGWTQCRKRHPCGSKHWHLLEEADKKDVQPDVKHVKAHRTQKENNDCKSKQFDVDQ